VVGVAEDDFRADFFEQVLRDAFDRGLGAYGHEHRRFDGSVRGGELAAAGWASGGVNLEGHLGIVRDAWLKAFHHGGTETRRRLCSGRISPCFSVSVVNSVRTSRTSARTTRALVTTQAKIF